MMPVRELVVEAAKLLQGGFRGVKLRLGYPTLEAISRRYVRCAGAYLPIRR